jgi:hypothetical protein
MTGGRDAVAQRQMFELKGCSTDVDIVASLALMTDICQV